MFSLFIEFKKSISYNQTWIFHDWTDNEPFQSTSLVSPSNLKISLVIYFLTIVIQLLQPRLISCYFSRISLPASHFLLCECGNPSTFKMPAIRHVCWGKLQVLSRHSWRENICAVVGRVLGTGLPGSPGAHTPRDMEFCVSRIHWWLHYCVTPSSPWNGHAFCEALQLEISDCFSHFTGSHG